VLVEAAVAGPERHPEHEPVVLVNAAFRRCPGVADQFVDRLVVDWLVVDRSVVDRSVVDRRAGRDGPWEHNKRAPEQETMAHDAA